MELQISKRQWTASTTGTFKPRYIRWNTTQKIPEQNPAASFKQKIESPFQKFPFSSDYSFHCSNTHQAPIIMKFGINNVPLAFRPRTSYTTLICDIEFYHTCLSTVQPSFDPALRHQWEISTNCCMGLFWQTRRDIRQHAHGGSRLWRNSGPRCFEPRCSTVPTLQDPWPWRPVTRERDHG